MQTHQLQDPHKTRYLAILEKVVRAARNPVVSSFDTSSATRMSTIELRYFIEDLQLQEQQFLEKERYYDREDLSVEKIEVLVSLLNELKQDTRVDNQGRTLTERQSKLKVAIFQLQRALYDMMSSGERLLGSNIYIKEDILLVSRAIMVFHLFILRVSINPRANHPSKNTQ